MDIPDEDTLDDLNSTLTEEPQLFDTSENDEGEFAGSNDKLRRHELLKRLRSTDEKIEKYDQSISDICRSCLEVNLRCDANSRINCDEAAKNIVLNIHEYISKLEDQFKELDRADSQITGVTDRVLRDIDEVYDRLIVSVTREINKKRELLKLEARVFKNESLVPLRACREQIHAQILKTKRSVSAVESVDNGISSTGIDKLISANRKIGGIPAVPALDELPYLSFKSPSTTQITAVLAKVHEVGDILRQGPVQIIDIEEKPASVFVKWTIADPEFCNEDNTYVLQKAIGEISDPTSEEFTTIYEGPNESYFVKSLEPNRSITLRVGLQSLESAWSSLRIAKTSISNYSWACDNKDYMITNNGTIATKMIDEVSTLFSRDALVDANQIIEFKFLEAPLLGTNQEGIALLLQPQGKKDCLRRQGSLMITANGKIFMDGEEKLMQLPSLYSGARIVFAITRRDEDTLRVNIECSDKAVTYDWSTETPLYFAARFLQCKKWNLMVK